MLSRILYQSKNVFLRSQPILMQNMCRKASTTQDLEEIIDFPPTLPKLVEESEDVKEVKGFNPRQQSLEEFLNIRFGPEMATINDDSRPERDRANFPRMVRAVWPEKTRLFIIPDSWFQMFYNKTGVTGPYVFGFGFLTFLFSKEIFVVEHELINGVCMAILTFAAIKMYGKQTREYLCSTVDTENSLWKEWQEGMIAFLNEMISSEALLQERSKSQKILFDAKRENIKLQLEAEFRRRQMVAYNEVRNRLDYQIAKQVAQRQYEQKHMVNWIIDSVAKSITPEQEREALKKCLSDLKQLSTKHQIFT